MPNFTPEEVYERSTKACFWTFVIGTIVTISAFVFLHWIVGLVFAGVTWLFWDSAGRASASARSELPPSHPDSL